jgi:hypothetical protein
MGQEEVELLFEYFKNKMESIVAEARGASEVTLSTLASQPEESKADSAAEAESFCIANIRPDLLLLQNQIEQAAFALRREDPVTGEQIQITAEEVRSNPQRQR